MFVNEAEIDSILLCVAKSLDLTKTDREKIVRTYNYVGEWLTQELSIEINVYPQGSFNLGTEIRPVNEKLDFDLDIVCELMEFKGGAGDLKKGIGNALKNNESFKVRLDREGRRCWTLEYQNYHIDILPSVRKEDGSLKITDKVNDSYFWTETNPKSYQSWFEGQSKSNILLESIEEVPVFKEKNTLQRIIQLIKCHRDVYFETSQNVNKDFKPISILLTTLIARDYQKSRSIRDAINIACDSMRMFSNKKPFILKNPSLNIDENFAEKWVDDRYVRNFKIWVEQLQKDFCNLYETRTSENPYKLACKMFGKETVARSVKMRKDNGGYLTTVGSLTGFGSGNLIIKPHTFYGV